MGEGSPLVQVLVFKGPSHKMELKSNKLTKLTKCI